MSFEKLVQKSLDNQVYQGAIVVAADKSGKLNLAKAYGKTSLADDAKPMQLDSVLQIASMTKLLTTIAVLQIVEKGLIGLDDDVVKHIPELIKEGVFKDGQNLDTEPVKKPVTLRLLLTHSAGATYDAWNPQVQKYKISKGLPIFRGTTVEERILYPLIYQPGTSWQYSTSIDWAGRVLERVTGETLDSYMKKNMFPQLGIKDITFFPTEEQKSRLAGITQRDDKTGGLIAQTGPFINDGAEDCFGGHGAFATMPDYFKILHSILVDDEKLLKKETTAQMFKPQLTPESRKTLQFVLSTPALSELFVGDFPKPSQYDWGLGGILVEEDNEGRRKKGTLIWSGMPNCYWFIDREAGVCGVFGTQVLPPGDLKVEETIRAFEYEINDLKSKL